ncbi:MAG: type II toxin-antitoxin system VapC family toxin [Methanobacterium sp.]
MPDKCVLDSSIIAAIFFQEKASKKAVQLVQDKDLFTVDLAIVEVANVAWKRVILFEENKDIIKEALKKSIEFINTSCEVIEMNGLIESSFKIAVKEKITVYDALFLDAARSKKVPLYTLDKKLKIKDDVEVLN